MPAISQTSFDLLLLDFDGTLCATRPAITHCMGAVLAGVEPPAPSEEAIAATIARGIGLEDSFAALAPALLADDPALLPLLVTRYREMYRAEAWSRTSLVEGWLETLRSFAALGVTTAIVSNKGEAAVRVSLARFGLDALIALVVGETPGVPAKPDPAPYERLIAPGFPGMARDRVVVVGDTDADIRFARNIGARSCWAAYGYGDPATCAALAPDLVIHDPRDLLAAWG